MIWLRRDLGKGKSSKYSALDNAAAQTLCFVKAMVRYGHTHHLIGSFNWPSWLVNDLDPPRLRYCGKGSLGESHVVLWIYGSMFFFSY